MEWTKIPTDLLQSRKSDKEILAITKYQLLWAMLERQPEDKIALRYMSPNQLKQALDYIAAIQQRINADIKSVSNHRNRQKIYYEKNQTLNKESDCHTDAHNDSHTDTQADVADKIRIDNKKEIYKESFEEWWSFFPKQRAGNKKKALEKYIKAIQEGLTKDFLLAKVKEYANSDEVARGYACGAEVYFSKCKYNNEYPTAQKGGYTRQFEGWENF